MRQSPDWTAVVFTLAAIVSLGVFVWWVLAELIPTWWVMAWWMLAPAAAR